MVAEAIPYDRAGRLERLVHFGSENHAPLELPKLSATWHFFCLLTYKPARYGLATRLAVSYIVQLAAEFHVQRPPQLAKHAALVSAYTDATSRHMVAARCCLLLFQEKINRLARALER